MEDGNGRLDSLHVENLAHDECNFGCPEHESTIYQDRVTMIDVQQRLAPKSSTYAKASPPDGPRLTPRSSATAPASSLRSSGQAEVNNEKEFASPGGSVIPGTQWKEPCASTEGSSRKPKIRIITIGLSRDLSEIKLKRTDTTLDLSQLCAASIGQHLTPRSKCRGWVRTWQREQPSKQEKAEVAALYRWWEIFCRAVSGGQSAGR